MGSQEQNLVLSVNAGSSSLKISLYEAVHSSSEPVTLLLTSTISSITSPPAHFSFIPSGKDANVIKDDLVDVIHDHNSAFSHFLRQLAHVASVNKERIKYTCHRVVHGGDYTTPVTITQHTYHHIKKLSDLAPLHNGSALSVIQASIDALPTSTSIAYFDSSSYAINQKIATERGLKKYGFHGLSYAFILRSVAQHLRKAPESLNLIMLHLGSGASACAIKNGKSFDTSMGLTPLNGLPGATRSGAIDPSGRITHDPSMAANIQVTEAEDILNRNSGWKAITGTTDFSVVTAKAELENLGANVTSSNPYRLAFDLFLDRILNFIGSYYLKLNGEVDALVFAGGIGEKGVELRKFIGENVACLGFQTIDEGKNCEVGKENAGRAKQILVCQTDEQLEMARECVLDKNLWNH
ncbi:acetate and butyrate kinase [Cyathus striatus]|nr:acetate and butyrate kinase [Cyathus striatus]